MRQPKDIDWLNGYKNKTRIYAVCKRQTHFRPMDTSRLKVRGWKKIFHADGNQKSPHSLVWFIAVIKIIKIIYLFTRLYMNRVASNQ